MTNLSAEHTLIAAIPLLVVTAVLASAIIILPKTNVDTRSRASEPPPSQVSSTQKPNKQHLFPATSEPSARQPEIVPESPYSFPSTSE